MHYVSLIVEFLRGRPRMVFWTAALAQAALWTAVPSLFYSAPPDNVPILLAIGHEFVLGSYLGPPLAFWFGEIAFHFAGVYGLYALSQACIVVTYWAVFRLGRATVGTRHAVLAVLLMVGVAAFTVPSPNFGPSVLAAPLWSLALLHYWRVLGEGRRGHWFLLALDLGLLLLTSYVGLILMTLIILFTPMSERGRRAVCEPEPWLALVLFGIVVFPHATWLKEAGTVVVAALKDSITSAGGLPPWIHLASTLLTTHFGFFLLVALVSGWPRQRRERGPEIDRKPVTPFARGFVYFFALAPAMAALALAYASGRLGPLNRVAPLVVLSGLAIVVAAGNRVMLYRERLVSWVWLALLMVPPLLVVLGLAVTPWSAKVNAEIAQPAGREARFFADTFRQRTGKPLRYVSGDTRAASLIALGARPQPHVYFAEAPNRSPWASAADLRDKGAVLVWPVAGNEFAPPAYLKAQFPEMVPEVPRAFERPVQGLLPLIRLGWAVLRPQERNSATTPPAQ